MRNLFHSYRVCIEVISGGDYNESGTTAYSILVWTYTLASYYALSLPFLLASTYAIHVYNIHSPLLSYSYTADIYSLSLIAWELYTGQCPFDQMHVSQIVAAVAVRGERPPIGPGVSAEQARLLQRYVYVVYILNMFVVIYRIYSMSSRVYAREKITS